MKVSTMRQPLTHAPLFMHGEPESAYKINLLAPREHAMLREIEIMERMHRSLAVQRQMQQSNSVTYTPTQARRRSLPSSSLVESRLQIIDELLPKHNESPEELLSGAARRLNHIVDGNKNSRRVVPTTKNQQYPTQEYNYAKRGDEYRMRRSSVRGDLSGPLCESSLNCNRHDLEASLTELSMNFSKTSSDHEPELLMESPGGEKNTAETKKTPRLSSAPLMVVTSPKAEKINKLLVVPVSRGNARTPTERQGWNSPRRKSLKTEVAWLETFPRATDIMKCAAAMRKNTAQQDVASCRSSSCVLTPGPMSAASEERGVSCTLTLDS